MSQLHILHQQAMDLAESAQVAKLRGELSTAAQLLQQALEKETQAAALVASDLSAEPTRSILHRSAASLAIDCEEFEHAERLITAALAGNPPKEITEELEDLLTQINARPLQELSLFEVPDRQLLVSLSQLRHWYAIARKLQQYDRLPRIAELGKLFKQTFGDANPDQPQPFAAWSDRDVEWWLDDLAQWEQQKGSASKSHSVNQAEQKVGTWNGWYGIEEVLGSSTELN